MMPSSPYICTDFIDLVNLLQLKQITFNKYIFFNEFYIQIIYLLEIKSPTNPKKILL